MPRGGSNRSGRSILDGMKDLLKDTLTVEAQGQPTTDPNTGVPSGPPPDPRLLIPPPGHVGPWMCSDQDVSPSRRFRGEINSGTPGSLPISICYTAWFQLPALAPGETLVYRVNGRYRPLMRQGPPQDIGAQKGLMELELGAPESGR